MEESSALAILQPLIEAENIARRTNACMRRARKTG
jgi:hypothetical protein